MNNLAPKDEAFVLDSQALHIHTRTCLCGHTMTWSTLYDVHVHRTRIGLNGSRRLTPVRSRISTLALSLVHTTPEQTAICLKCTTTSAPRTQSPLSETEWALTLKRKYEAPRPIPQPMSDAQFARMMADRLAPPRTPTASDL